MTYNGYLNFFILLLASFLNVFLCVPLFSGKNFLVFL